MAWVGITMVIGEHSWLLIPGKLLKWKRDHTCGSHVTRMYEVTTGSVSGVESVRAIPSGGSPRYTDPDERVYF